LHKYISAYTATDTLSALPISQGYFDAGVLPGRVTELFCADEMPTFWLPLLPITNPPRKDPWPISQHIRQTAYFEFQRKGILRGETVLEMIRRGERMVPEPVTITETNITVRNDREVIFITAMKLLIQNVADEDLRFLRYFVEMYILLGQPVLSSSSSCSAVLSPTLQYVTIQYQSIIYSLIILLQSKSPTSVDIPAFASLWDLGHFKTAITQTVAGAEDIWKSITDGMGPGYELVDTTSKTSLRERSSAKKAKKSNTAAPAARSDPQRICNNPFSVLSVSSNSAAP